MSDSGNTPFGVPNGMNDDPDESNSADDYDIDDLYADPVNHVLTGEEAKIEPGEPEQQWPDYGLEMVPVEYNGEDTGRRLLLRDGDFLKVVSDRYKILPNERAAGAAEKAAERLGAVPFEEFSGDWYIPLDDHIFQDDDGRRVHALYAWDDPVDVSAPDEPEDTIQFGFAVHNSIDTSLGFQVSLFTFRHACANMTHMGLNGRGMDFDDREVVAHSSRKHTSGLDVDIDALVERIENTMLLAETVEEKYRAWRDEFVTVRQAKELAERFPKKDLPEWIRDALEAIERAEENEQLEEVEDPEGFRDSIFRSEMPASETVWDTYNAVTQSVTHSDRGNDRTRLNKHRDLHRVFPVLTDD